MAEKHSPLDQFSIHRIFDLKIGEIDVSFTNSSLMMVIILVLLNIFLILATRKKSLVPDKLQSLAEMSYEMIFNTTRDNLGNNGAKFFPFVFFLVHIFYFVFQKKV